MPDNVDARRIGQAGEGLLDRLHRVDDGVEVVARIARVEAGADCEPRYETYRVPGSKWMRVLDVLTHIAEEQEQDIAHRWFCGVKKCGTCAVRVNGREVLACWEPAEPDMTIEPLRHAPVVRDLVVDRRAYEEKVLSLFPWIKRAEPYSGFPERISHVEMKKAAKALDCLSCLACYSACPVLDLGEATAFAGPAPLVQLAQTALDPRDAMDRGRLVAERASIFECVSCYKCEEVCPAEIPIVSGVIEPLKAKVYESRPDAARHSRALMDVVWARGRVDPAALVLKIQGVRALVRLDRVLRLLLRGKIDPWKTFFGKPMPGIERTRRLFEWAQRPNE